MPDSAIHSFIKEYYSLLDSLANVEELQSFFNEKSFVIIEADMRIDSLERYAKWYEETKKQFSKREHIINSIDIKKRDGLYIVVMDMDFEATRSTGELVHIKNAEIIWHLQSINYKFKIKRYEINI